MIYKIIPLPIPQIGDKGIATKLNNKTGITGWVHLINGDQRAVFWKGGANQPSIAPVIHSTGIGINSNDEVVGNSLGVPFHWNTKTGLATDLKGFDSKWASGYAFNNNDAGEITGGVANNPPDIDGNRAVVWLNETTVPNDLGNPPVQTNIIQGMHGADINANGLICGNTEDFGGRCKAFFWDGLNPLQNLTGGTMTTRASAMNDLIHPQIVGSFYLNSPIDIHAFIYDTNTGHLEDIGIPGIYSFAKDINNNGTVCGHSGGKAVVWNGNIMTSLNHPMISDALVNGWFLEHANSINDKGEIVGVGKLDGDPRPLPFLLTPLQYKRIDDILSEIPVEHMLPQSLWPGQAWDAPRPKRWPRKWPFPLPAESPFQLVGKAHQHLENILISERIQKSITSLTLKKTKNQLSKISLQLFNEEIIKLKDEWSKNFVKEPGKKPKKK